MRRPGLAHMKKPRRWAGARFAQEHKAELLLSAAASSMTDGGARETFGGSTARVPIRRTIRDHWLSRPDNTLPNRLGHRQFYPLLTLRAKLTLDPKR